MKKLRWLTGMVLVIVLLCLTVSTALATDGCSKCPVSLNNLCFSVNSIFHWDSIFDSLKKCSSGTFGSSWGDSSYFDDNTRPWGSGHFGSSWGEHSYFDDNTKHWGSGHFGSSWGERSCFDGNTKHWDSRHSGSSRCEHSCFDGNTKHWSSGHSDCSWCENSCCLTFDLANTFSSACTHLQTALENITGCTDRLSHLLCS